MACLGSIIRTDCWAGYNDLAIEGYTHQTVNHSAEFVSETGVHTNRIESSWRPLKDHFRRIKIRSVCPNCQAKFNDAKVNAQEIEDKEERSKHIKAEYKEIREARADCVDCKEHENNFGVKLVEYLWHRENRKSKADPFERLMQCIRSVYTLE